MGSTITVYSYILFVQKQNTFKLMEMNPYKQSHQKIKAR